MAPYELPAYLKDAEQRLDEDLHAPRPGDTTPDPLGLIEAMANEWTTTAAIRIEDLIRWAKNLESDRDSIATEISRLQARRTFNERRIEAVRNYIMGLMRSRGFKKLKTSVGTVSICAGRERIVITEGRPWWDWPEEVKAVALQETVTVRKDVLKERFGDRLKDLPGVSVECGDDYLLIR